MSAIKNHSQFFIYVLLFLLEWKKDNIVPIQKKSDKQCIKNYRSVLLLLIRGKILEKLILDQVFKWTVASQSGFKLGDSYINQLLSATPDIYKSFNEGYEVRWLFLIYQKVPLRSYYFQFKTKWFQKNSVGTFV